MEKPNVTVLGWYGHGNCGDESYKLTFPMVFPNCNFQFTESITKAHAGSSCFILGGGNVVSESFLNQLEKAPAKAPKHLMSVSIVDDSLIPRVASLATSITVRDFKSLQRLHSHNVAGRYMPDFAFMMKPNPTAGDEAIKQAFKECGHELYQKRVAVIVNAYLATRNEMLSRDQATFESFSWHLARIMDNTSASFILIPFGTQPPADDRVSNCWVHAKCKFFRKNLVVYEEMTPQQTLDMLSACDAVISSRLHSSIFATIAGKPFVDITHHDKNRVFLESIYKRDWSVSYWDFDRKECADLLNDFLFNKSLQAKELEHISENNRLMLSGVHNHVRLC